MTHKKIGRVHKMRRQERAAERQSKVSQDPEQRYMDLDNKLGVGVGAAKERAKLLAQIPEPFRAAYENTGE